ncbi:Double-stranded RNA-binding protein 4 [Spatholobus suberectus]|nr:Double-stranded RNA-binding protein 4 [Spatholobus suberectus]
MDTPQPQLNIVGSSPTPPNVTSMPPSSSLPRPSPPISAAPQPGSSSSAPLPGVHEHEANNYKNRLQTFTQRSNIALPVYITVNEGVQHDPKYRTKVLVDGVSYPSPNTFSQVKAAEQDGARVVLENLPVKFRAEGCPVICENTPFSKSILNEYTTKLKVEKPTYNTVRLEGMLPLFVSSLTFNGTQYSGDAARSKKKLSSDATSGTLYEIIKSKYKIFDAVRPGKSQCVDALNASSAAMANTGPTLVSPDHTDKEVAVPVAANSNETKIALPVPSTMPSVNPESQMPKHVPSLVAVPVAANSNETKIALPAPFTIPSLNPQSLMPKHVPSVVAVPVAANSNETQIALLVPSTMLSLNLQSLMPKHVPSLVAVPVAANSNETQIALPVPSTMPSLSPQSLMPKHVPSLVADPVAANSNETQIALPVPSTMPSLNPQSQMPEHVPSLQATVAELPNLNLRPGSEQPVGNGSGELSIGDGSDQLSSGDGSGSKKRQRLE